MLTIKRNNFKIEVNKINKKIFELKRISKTQVITTYARRKDIDAKINILSLPIAEVKKAYNF